MSTKWNMSIPWVKKSDYIIRCTEEILAPNSNGNLMFTLKFEVQYPNTVEDSAGEEMVVAGTPLTYWCVVQSLTGSKNQSPEEATEACKGRYRKLREAFDLPNKDIDWDNPPGGFKGKLVYAQLDNEENVQRGAPSKADLIAGKKEGPVLVNPKTKKPLIKYYPKIAEIFGTAELPSSNTL